MRDVTSLSSTVNIVSVVATVAVRLRHRLWRFDAELARARVWAQLSAQDDARLADIGLTRREVAGLAPVSGLVRAIAEASWKGRQI